MDCNWIRSFRFAATRDSNAIAKTEKRAKQ